MMIAARFCSALTVLALLVALPAAAAVEAPKQAVGEETTLMLWVDLDQISPEMIKSVGGVLAEIAENPMLEQAGGAVPMGDIQESVTKLTDFRNRFVNAGGTGLLMTLGMPAEGSWSPSMSMLAKSKGDVDAGAMSTLMTEMSEGMIQEAACNALGGDWFNLEMTGHGGEAVTHALPTQSEVAYKSFDRQLGEGGKPVMRLAFRVQEQMREMMQGMVEGAGQPADPNMAMAAAMLEPLKQLDTVGLSISQAKGGDGEGIEVDAQMVFLNAEAATNFNAMYQTMMMLAPAMVAQQLAGVPDAPDANEINNFFGKLRMTQDNDALRLKLDAEFFDMAEQMIEKLENLAQEAGNDIPI